MSAIFQRGYLAGCEDAKDCLAGKPPVVITHHAPPEKSAWAERYDFLAGYSRGIQHVLNQHFDRRRRENNSA